ncbi:DUF4431 domain-containing protein [Legionella tunisiensis]|uniref:DUF4431 domain-containing protein n=1 Tax=Legionella tunisiensis TaxID=1034944 RepID=UPI00031354B8|nr:DUF4431 domain-containing protein [Legionella tunisiensis]
MKILACLLILIFSPLAIAERCLIEGKEIKLEGKLGVQTFPGLPNYERVKKGDEPETYWILTTEKSYCGIGRNLDNGKLYRLDRRATKFQLVLTAEQYREKKDLLNKKVIVEGNLFLAHTGHHHTEMLIELTSMEAAP